MAAPISQQRDRNFDFMKAVAIICVLIIHCAFGCESTGGANQQIADWLGTFTRPCIAIFLFVAGYFFTRNTSRAQMFLRLKRILIPYLLFSVLAFLYQTRVIHALETFLAQPGLVLRDLLIGNTWGIYWFIPVILTNSLLGWWLIRDNRPSLIWITLAFFVINLIHTAYFDRIVALAGIADDPGLWLYSYRFYVSWPFYFFFGALAHQYQLVRVFRTNRKAVVLLWLLVFVTYNLLFAFGVVQPGGYNSVIDTLASLSAIAALCTLQVNVPLFSFIGETSYTIYLFHFFLFSITRRLSTLVSAQPPYWFSLVIFTVTMSGSVAFCWLSKRLLGRHARVWLGI